MSCLILVACLAATPTTQPNRPAIGAGAVMTVSRADLARAYLRVERALAEHKPPAADVARISRAYDTAALQFFTGRYSESVQTLNDLAESLLPPPQRTQAARVANAIKVRVAPVVALSTRPSAMHIKLTALYPVPAEATEKFRLIIKPLNGEQVILDHPVEIAPNEAPPNFTIRQPTAPPGTYRVLLVSAAGEEFDVGRWFVSQAAMEAHRSVNTQRLSGVKRDDPRLYQAIVACGSRINLLTDKPGEVESIRFSTDLVALSQEVSGEVESLLQGRDPYVNRPGDWWRAFPAGAMQIPARVYAPPDALSDALKSGKQLPLIIALHAAGADENAFMEGYGFGQIKRLAAKHGFIVVSPGTNWVAPNPQAFGSIVDSMAMDYPIDRSRVYLIGHSLGAAAALNIAAKNPDDVAALALLGGSALAGVRKLPPTLMITGGLDAVFPPEKLKEAVAAARAAGLSVEFETMESHGHVLLANDALPRAVEWLMKHGHD